MGKVTCCRDCTERHPACHDTCERYAEQKRQAEETKKVAREYYKLEGAIHETKARLYWSVKKGHRR